MAASASGSLAPALAAINLEQHLDSMDKLPNELQKNYTQIRNLDSKTKKLSQRIDQESDLVLAQIKAGSLNQKKHKEEVNRIQKLYSKLYSALDEKVAIAVQVYELVDKQIRYLDADLSRFQAECRESEKKQAAVAVLQPATSSGSSALKKAVAVGSRRLTSGCAMKGRKRARANPPEGPGKSTAVDKATSASRRIPAAVAAAAALALPLTPHLTAEATADGSVITYPTETPADVFDMPVDPNEPTYCLCQQVSFGSMIACDSKDCLIEWFHFPCVGLTVQPKGKWYCPSCSEERKKRK